jgi:hypothetical protein
MDDIHPVAEIVIAFDFHEIFSLDKGYFLCRSENITAVAYFFKQGIEKTKKKIPEEPFLIFFIGMILKKTVFLLKMHLKKLTMQIILYER